MLWILSNGELDKKEFIWKIYNNFIKKSVWVQKDVYKNYRFLRGICSGYDD